MNKNKGAAISAYRNLVKLANLMPSKKRSQTLKEIRYSFRANASETDPARIREMLEKAQSSLGFLKIVTPKRPGDSGQPQSGRSRIVYGTDKNTGSKVVTNWHGGNMDPDSVARHNNGLKRAGFQNNAHAKGIF
jgi:hypothetical protein